MQPLRRESVSEQIFNILKKEIADGQWKPGEKIPSETELAARFGVSRMSARSALQRLISIGLLESRVGEGTFVKEFRLSEYFGEVVELMDSDKTMEDISEFRLAFEAAVMQIACQRRTQEDIDKVIELYHEMEGYAAAGDWNSFTDCDLRFHSQLVAISRNSVFTMVDVLIRDLLKAHYRENAQLFTETREHSMNPDDDNYYLKVLCQEHLTFIEALQNHDATIAVRDWEDRLRHYKAYKENKA